MPVTPENCVVITAKLAAMIAAMDDRAHAHFHWILTAYLDLSDEAFDAEIAKQRDRILSNDTEKFLSDAVTAYIQTATVPPEITDALERLGRCAKAKQVVMIQKLAYELFARQQWERVMAKTPDEFGDILKAGLPRE